jgi:L-serine dehydratase
MGPMKAAYALSAKVAGFDFSRTSQPCARRSVRITRWTGKGHGTDKAVILSLFGERPDAIDPDAADRIVINVRKYR